MSQTKKQYINFILLALLFISFQSISSQEQKLNAYVDETLQKYKIPDAAVAILKDGKVIYKKYKGLANLDYSVEITEKSLFRLHSLSKVFVSVGIFQLIEQGKLSLEDSISKYLEDVPETWKRVKIKNLLSHSSGLPDIKDESGSEKEVTQAIYKQPTLFSPGERAQYNQTNFWLLNRIIQKITGKSLNEYIVQNQFEDNNGTAFFSNTSEIVPNRISEYKPDNHGTLAPFNFLVPEYMYGAAGMTISLDAFIDWNRRLQMHQLISDKSKESMLTPFSYKRGKGFTLGWDPRYVNQSISYGFNGGGLTNYRIYPKQKIAIIWLTNGYETPYNMDRVANDLAGMIDRDLIDPTPKIFRELFNAFDTKSEADARKIYTLLKKKHPYVDFLGLINGLGYEFIGEGKLSKAISVFTLNTVEFPNEPNVFDSLAEAYFIRKEYQVSSLHYQKAVALGGTNGNAKKMLEKIKQIKKN